MFRPPSLLTTQVAPTAVALCPLGSRGVYFQAFHVLLPPRDLEMLAARIEQLAAGDFHPISIRSLVGCSSTLRTHPVTRLNGKTRCQAASYGFALVGLSPTRFLRKVSSTRV